MHSEDKGAAPRELARLLRRVLLVAAALGLTAALQLAGLVASVDDGLRAQWFSLTDRLERGPEGEGRVVLIAGDARSVEAWGPPPWSGEELESLARVVEAGGGELMVEVGHGRMFTGPRLDEAVAGRAKTLMLQEPAGWRSPWVEGGLEHGALRLSEGGRLREAIARSESLPAVGGELPVHWLASPHHLPTVSAWAVASGELRPTNFAGRVVLLGVTDPEYAMLVDTPLGRMSTAEVEAHALAGLAEGRVGWAIPPALLWLAAALLGFLTLLLFERTRGWTATVTLTLAVLALLGLDYLLLEQGWARLDLGRLLFTLIGVSLAYWILEAVETLAGLGALRARVLLEATGDGTGEDDEAAEAGFWDDLAQLGTEYATELVEGHAASSMLERVDESWKLALRGSSKLDPDSHAALAARENLDLRRAPFRASWLTLRAAWTDELLPRGARYGDRRTLIVPLENDGELLGLWLVHAPVEIEEEIDKHKLESFERLGRQMAVAVIRRRERAALREQAGSARLRDHIETIVGGLRLLHDKDRWALELLHQLPVQAIIATVWGEIEFVDPRLRKKLRTSFPGLFSEDAPEDNLRAVIARLTGESLDEAHRLMRKVINEDVEVQLDVTGGLADSDDQWVMSRIQSKRGIELPGFKPAVHEHILLMARPSSPVKTVRTRSGGVLKVLSGTFGGR